MLASSPLLCCTAVGRRYDDETHPLKSIDFECSAGEFVAITGPSGAGKSTLLNILGMLDRPDDGEYVVDGQSVAELSDRELDEFRGRVFGFVFQASHLIAGRTVAQNLATALQYSQPRRADLAQRIRTSLENVGMLHKLNSRVDELSGGERQRVAIARALAHSPRVVFMDEPTGNLDEENTEIVVSLIERLAASGITIVVVTHDDRVSRRADRELRLADGRLADKHPSDHGSRYANPEPQPFSEHRGQVSLRGVAADALFGLGSRPFRAAMAVAIVAMGTAGLVVASSLSVTASRQVDESIRSSAGSQVQVSFDPEHDRTLDPGEVSVDLQHLAVLDGVRAAGIRWDIAELKGPVVRTSDLEQPDLRTHVRVIATGGDFAEAMSVKVAPGNASSLISSGELPVGAAALGVAAARALGVASASPGQVFWIGGQQLSVVGLLAASASDTENLDDAILVSFTTGQAVASSVPPGVFVLSTEMGMAPEVARIAPLAIDASHPEWVQVETTAELRVLRETVNSQFGQLVASVALVLVLLAVLVTTAITLAGVNGRRSEIALRRAVGARRSEIAALFTVENAIVGLLGGFLGVAIGEGATLAGSALLGWTPAIPGAVLFVGPLVGVTVAALAAVAPSVRSASIQPSLELHAA